MDWRSGETFHEWVTRIEARRRRWEDAKLIGFPVALFGLAAWAWISMVWP